MRNISDKIRSYKDEILEDVVRLVRIQSVRGVEQEGMPFGEGPAKALEYCTSLAQSMGFAVKNVDGRAIHIEYGEGEGLIGVLAHCDVVPAGEGWTLPPFGGEVINGRIYGRGTMDDKGPAISAIYCLKALKDLKIITKRRIRVIIGASEECGMEDMEYYFEHEEMPDWVFSPDGDYPICNREKGILRVGFESNHDGESLLKLESGSAVNIVPVLAEAMVRVADTDILEKVAARLEKNDVRFAVMGGDGTATLRCFGKSAHASTPEEGKNAAASLIRLLNEALGKKAGTLIRFLDETIGLEWDGAGIDATCQDNESGALTVNLGIVYLDGGRDKAIIDIRYPVTKNGVTIFEAISNVATKYGVCANLISDSAPLFVDEDSPLIQKLKHAYNTVTGEEGYTFSTGGGSYARVLNNRGVAFGAGIKPLSYYNIHGADEFLEIDDFMRHCEICLQAIYELACD